MLHKDAKPPDDEWTARLRDSVRRHRRWTWPGLLVTLVIFAIPVALFVWWFYPEPPPPALKLSAFDTLGPRGDKVTLRARLEPEDAAATVALAGHEIIFETGSLGQTKVLGKATTGKDGMAELTWSTQDERTSFIARFVGDEKRRAAQADAKVYIWPRETPMFIVEAAALADANAAVWNKAHIQEIEARAGSVPSLQKAEAQAYKVVYLAPESEGGPAYAKLAGWVKDGVARRGFPQGPILGGLPTAFAAALKDVRRIVGNHLGVAASPELAKEMRVEWDVVFLGDKAPLAAMPTIAAWTDVPALLGKNKK
jgi:hypothetical protein